MINTSPHTVVIGAGFGGLAAALRFRARGHRVTVIDRLSGPGGRGIGLQRGAFRYDAGPTVITAPHLFEELFALFGERLADHVQMLPVKPWYQMRFADGSVFNYGGDTQDIQAEIAKFSTADARAYPAYLDYSRRLFEVGYEKLGSQPFLNMAPMLKAMPAMLRLRVYRSVYELTSAYFEDERIRRAFSIQPLLVGGNPFDTTSIYSLIHYLERKWGVWFPKGGTAALVDALKALGERHGVEFRFGQTVDHIQTQGAAGVQAVHLPGGERLACNQVVANADPGYVLTHMLGGEHARVQATSKRQYSMSLFVCYFSTRKRYESVAHHSILFGQTYKETLRNIFKGSQVPQDLSIYLHRPTATDPDYAPPGHDSFYALVPVPNLRSGIDWNEEAGPLQEHLIRVLQERLLPDLQSQLVDVFHLTPNYFQDQLLSPWGAGFSLQPTLLQSASFRYPNQSPDVAGLYFVGAGTHPGAGVPGVVTSAKVVERLAFGAVA
jgi:phytoene desaturase